MQLIKLFSVQELEEAMDLSEDQFKAKYGFEKLKDDPNLVIYCRSGRRVGIAKEILAGKGFSLHR